MERNCLAGERTSLPPLDLVFFDTTSLYFEGEGGDVGELCHSKGHRPHLNQVVIGVVLDEEGDRAAPRCGRGTPPR